MCSVFDVVVEVSLRVEIVDAVKNPPEPLHLIGTARCASRGQSHIFATCLSLVRSGNSYWQSTARRVSSTTINRLRNPSTSSFTHQYLVNRPASTRLCPAVVSPKASFNSFEIVSIASELYNKPTVKTHQVGHSLQSQSGRTKPRERS